MRMPDIGGEILHTYRPIRLLGRGGITESYVSEERATGRRVVLKVAQATHVLEDQATFQHTLQRYSQVLHPHLVRVVEYGVAAARPFLVTEYASKGSLRQRHFQGVQLTPDLVATYARPIADALQHLHDQHLLHLGIKPENVLVREDGALMVDDGGLAALPSTLKQAQEVFAERAFYLAPEQIQGTPSPASDQYALACLLYEWLSGRPPFTGAFAEVVARHLATEPVPGVRTHLPTLSLALEQVLTCALAKDPANRFASVRAFANAFEQACHEPTSLATFVPATPSLPQSEGKPSAHPTPALIPLTNESQTPGQGPKQPASMQPTPVLTPLVNADQVLEQTPVVRAVSGTYPTRAPVACLGCGYALPAQDEAVCPTCGYPLKIEQEVQLLDTALRDLRILAAAGGAALPIGRLAQISDTSVSALRRVARYGGAQLNVVGLTQRYQRRLQTLLQAPTSQAGQVGGVQGVSPSAPTNDPVRVAASISQGSIRPNQVLRSAPSGTVPAAPPSRAFPPSTPPVQRPRPVPRAPRRSPITTLRPLIESPAGLMVALGTFLLLLAILVLPFAFRGSPLPLPLTLGAQAFFVVMTIATRRSPRFRDFSGIYAGFFALTVPLLALDVFQSSLMTNLPWLIGLAALYATITYGAFAILQRFSPFGVLSVTALLVADIALTRAVTGSYQWVAATLLIVTTPGVAALSRPANATRSPLAELFATSWDVLRRPVTIFLWVVAVGIACVYVPATSFLILNSFTRTAFFFVPNVTFSLLITLLLLLAWFCNLVRASQWRNGHYVVPLQILLTVLFACYTLNQAAIQSHSLASGQIYGLGLLLVALMYTLASRWLSPRLQLFLRSGVYLSIVTLVLLVALPLVVVPNVPREVFLSAFPFFQSTPAPALLFDALLLGVGGWLIMLVAFRPLGARTLAGEQRMREAGWPWLLLFSGLLFTWGYGALGLGLAWLHISPFWWFWGLTLFGTLVAVLARLRFEKRWSMVCDVLVVGEALLTLLLGVAGQGGASISLALLSFATLFYGVLLFQRRSLWLPLPWLFALADLPNLFANASGFVLLLGLFLPFVAAAVRRGMPGPRALQPPDLWHEEQLDTRWQWDWPLVMFALICGAFILVNGFSSRVGVSFPWLHASLPVVAEFAAFALVWYLMAALGRTTWWLIPVGVFALALVVFVDQSFWALTGIAAGSAVAGLVISRFARGAWSLPCYLTALVGALFVVPLSFLSPQLLVSAWVLLGFAGMVVLVGVMEAQPEVLWLVPVFATVSLLNSLVLYFIGGRVVDFIHLPAVVLLSVGVGVLVGRVMRQKNEAATLRESAQRWRWLAPCYVTAFLAACLTGLSFIIISRPPVFQLIPTLLFGYALLAFLVIVQENVPIGNILVIGLGVWGLALSARAYPNLLLAIGAGLLILAVLADRALPYTRSWPLASGVVRASWGLAWTLLAELAWVSAGLFPPAFLRAILPDYPIFVLLVFVAFFYLTGLIQRQGFLCLLTPLFALWPLWELTSLGAFFTLFFVFCACLVATVGADLLTRSRYEMPSVRMEVTLLYVLPILLTASLAACLSGVAGSVFAPIAQRGTAGGLLLIYSLGIWLVLLLMRQPRFTVLTAAFGLWGVLLIMQTPVYTILGWQVSTDLVLTGLGAVATLLGLCTFQRIKPVPTGGQSSESIENGPQIFQHERTQH